MQVPLGQMQVKKNCTEINCCLCLQLQNMSEVDLCDQEMAYYPTLRKLQGKYYVKFFRQFMD